MQLAELRLVTASNIIKLRTGAGMTQAELGHALNYSDKTISKWERGESLPDAFVLKQMGEMFGVTVDYLLSSHDAWEPPVEKEPKPVYSVEVIIAVVLLGIWTAALASFVVLWLFDIVWWPIFVVALPVSLLVYLILQRVLIKQRNIQYTVAALVLSLFICLFVFWPGEPWQLLLILIPAEAIVFLSCNMKKKPKRRKK